MGHYCKLYETPSAQDANFVKCTSLMPELVKSFCLDSLFLLNTTHTLCDRQPTNLKLANNKKWLNTRLNNKIIPLTFT